MEQRIQQGVEAELSRMRDGGAGGTTSDGERHFNERRAVGGFHGATATGGEGVSMPMLPGPGVDRAKKRRGSGIGVDRARSSPISPEEKQMVQQFVAGCAVTQIIFLVHLHSRLRVYFAELRSGGSG